MREDDRDEDLESEDFEDLEDSDAGSIDGEDMHLVAHSMVWFAVGLVVGAVVGAGAALLSAPARGGTTRRRVRRQVKDLADEAKEQVDDWRADVRKVFERRRQKIRRR